MPCSGVSEVIIIQHGDCSTRASFFANDSMIVCITLECYLAELSAIRHSNIEQTQSHSFTMTLQTDGLNRWIQNN